MHPQVQNGFAKGYYEQLASWKALDDYTLQVVGREPRRATSHRRCCYRRCPASCSPTPRTERRFLKRRWAWPSTNTGTITVASWVRVLTAWSSMRPAAAFASSATGIFRRTSGDQVHHLSDLLGPHADRAQAQIRRTELRSVAVGAISRGGAPVPRLTRLGASAEQPVLERPDHLRPARSVVYSYIGWNQQSPIIFRSAGALRPDDGSQSTGDHHQGIQRPGQIGRRTFPRIERLSGSRDTAAAVRPEASGGTARRGGLDGHGRRRAARSRGCVWQEDAIRVLTAQLSFSRVGRVRQRVQGGSAQHRHQDDRRGASVEPDAEADG